ncbi:hypothetical protein PVAG01_07622 [Phlyctema vagabunda]|uniref:Zn(2)-C6 fungal-type domain-containing protein n=1 Tax=Phlyctema vagabunda TaxID=108571 RepID=A0ABR4PDE1_9HELO
MVFCGKPSKSCQACREKKTRCDRALPECSQCIRTNRPCSGYRDQLDLMFRHESDVVAKKSKTKRTKSKSVCKKQPTYPMSNTSDVTYANSDLVGPSIVTIPSHTMQPSIEEVAGAFFNTHYEMRSVGGSFDFFNFDNLDTLCTPQDMDGHLVACINAVGLAGFANTVHSSVLMRKALCDYSAAIKLTNAALQSPTEVTKDSTLFSVIILSIFETVTGSSQSSFQAWTEHTKGASTLVKLRGRDQFKTHAGRRLFLQITSNLMISCIQRTARVPEYISELRIEAEKYVESSNPAWKMSKIIIDCSNFRAGVVNGSITGPQQIINEASEIDRRFVEIFCNIPQSWHYNIVHTDEYPELIWNGVYHSYQNYWIAQVWNAMRTCRILLHEIIHSQLKLILADSPVPFIEQECLILYQNSCNILFETRSDILASVAEHTKTKITNSAAHQHSLYTELEDPTNASALLGTRGYFVLWPLYLVGSMDLSTPEIRAWVANRLRLLADETGIKQAAVLAEFVGRYQVISAWDRDVKWNGLEGTMIPFLDDSSGDVCGGFVEGVGDVNEVGGGRSDATDGSAKALRVLSY